MSINSFNITLQYQNALNSSKIFNFLISNIFRAQIYKHFVNKYEKSAGKFKFMKK